MVERGEKGERERETDRQTDYQTETEGDRKIAGTCICGNHRADITVSEKTKVP